MDRWNLWIHIVQKSNNSRIHTIAPNHEKRYNKSFNVNSDNLLNLTICVNCEKWKKTNSDFEENNTHEMKICKINIFNFCFTILWKRDEIRSIVLIRFLKRFIFMKIIRAVKFLKEEKNPRGKLNWLCILRKVKISFVVYLSVLNFLKVY